MSKRAMMPILIAAVGLAGCAADGAATNPSGAVRASISDRQGTVVAVSSARDQGGLAVRVDVNGMPAGTYGVHVHAIGRCEAPEYQSAGPHWNPTARQHGRLNPMGPHYGDLPNLVVDAAGRGSVEFTIAGGSVRGGAQPLMDADGASVVIHAAADDERTDPSGNSGARIACGVFG
jgi:Cu-Zn family superoxide dismutase